MGAHEKLRHELKALAGITLYFAIWFGVVMLLKKLLLAQYDIEFNGLALVLLGAILLAKVVLLMEYFPVESWVPNHPAMVAVLLRTFIYGIGVLVALTLEKAFEARHEYGGFGRAMLRVYQHPEYPRVLFNTICVMLALLYYNIFSVLRRHLGKNGLGKLFFGRPGPKPEEIH
ncbi:MAG TPA: hypothetical protein VMH87_11715 [Pseudomonadales bacterium]|nr:hypothetical protein [Pseudomonadales bacterium]